MVCQGRDGCAFITEFEGGALMLITGILVQVRIVGSAWHGLRGFPERAGGSSWQR